MSLGVDCNGVGRYQLMSEEILGKRKDLEEAKERVSYCIIHNFLYHIINYDLLP